MAEARPITLAVLAKAPVPGFAKTRLAPRLGLHGAAALQAVLVERAVASGLAAGFDEVVLWCAPAAAAPFLERLGRGLARAGLVLRDQPGGDLGARLTAAAEAALAAGPVVLVGTDSPELTPARLAEARLALAGGEPAVLVPAHDGGYALLGLAVPAPGAAALFEGIAWSTGGVLEATRARLAAQGLRWRELAPVRDVDRPEDVDWLLESGLLGAVDTDRIARFLARG